jgi:hypothetical protein
VHLKLQRNLSAKDSFEQAAWLSLWTSWERKAASRIRHFAISAKNTRETSRHFWEWRATQNKTENSYVIEIAI